MKFHLRLGSEFNNQIIGVQFVMCFVAATVEGTVGQNCRTHRRIKLKSASSQLWSNDILIEDIPNKLAQLYDLIAEFSTDQRFREATDAIRDLAIRDLVNGGLVPEYDLEQELERLMAACDQNSGWECYPSLDRQRKDILRQIEGRRTLTRWEFINLHGYQQWLTWTQTNGLPENHPTAEIPNG